MLECHGHTELEDIPEPNKETLMFQSEFCSGSEKFGCISSGFVLFGFCLFVCFSSQGKERMNILVSVYVCCFS